MTNKPADCANLADSAHSIGRDAVRWRKPGQSPNRMALLARRHLIIREIRADLDEQCFLEVQTPLVVRGTAPDLHLDSVRTESGYLVTSTEYQLKRMIAGGFERLYTLTQNFRAGDLGPTHNPEFTMLEWARANDTLESIEADVERFTKRAFARIAPDSPSLRYKNHEVRIEGAWERLTVRDALKLHLGIDVAEDFEHASLVAGAERAGLTIPATFATDRHLFISWLLDVLQAKLGTKTPTFLREWPAFMTSSARLLPANPALAERSELFIAGMEIADGFPSLVDAKVQRALFERELERRRQEGKEAVAIDARYLAALEEGIPPGAGMALGIDRLVMVLTGAETIREVMAFGWDEV